MTVDARDEGREGTGHGPLAGWRVLVPRAGEWGDRVTALLAERGATATVVPLIEFESPDDVGPLDDAVVRLAQGGYDWLVVTSRTAVLALGSRAFTLLGGTPGGALAAALARARGRTRVAAVGPGTARALGRFGVEVHLMPQGERSGRGLVAEFPPPADADADAGADTAASAAAGTPDADARGPAVLHPRSDLADDTVRDGLAALGWRVDAPVAYRTVTGTISGTRVREDVLAGRFDAVLLSSGSTVRSMGELGCTPPPGTVIACIGPRTERAAHDAGLPVHAVAQEPTAEGLVDALARYVAGEGAR